MPTKTDLLAEAYRRGILPPEKKAAYEEAARRGLVPAAAAAATPAPAAPTAPAGPEPRSLGERLVSTAVDSFNRSGLAQLSRSIDPGADGVGLGDIFRAPEVVPGSLADKGLGALGIHLGDASQPTAAGVQEAARRAAYETRANADPFYRAPGGLPGKIAAGAATLGGALAGGGLSPENWTGGGGAKTIIGRLAFDGAANAGLDAVMQQGDLAAGAQDKYSAEQTIGAGLTGAALSGIGEVAARFFTKGPAAAPGTPAAAAEEAAVAQAIADPNVRAQLEASGVTAENPRYQAFLQRAEQRATQQSAAAAPQDIVAAASREVAESGTISPETAARLQALQEAPNVPPTTREDVGAALAGDVDPSTIRAPSPAPPRETIPVDPQGQGRVDPGAEAGKQVADALPGEMRQIAVEEGRSTAPVSVDQTRADMDAQSRGAFDQAASQRARLEARPDTLDTQAAPRPEGVAPKPVLLDEGFPVQVIREEPDGRVTVRRYDPRTGAPETGAVSYTTSRAALTEKAYAAEPRMAQDFTGRADGPPAPEQPRMSTGPVTREPEQTFRATAADQPEGGNPFPGANGPDGRPPLPDQPDGPGPFRQEPGRENAQRAANEEELRSRYEQARADEQYQQSSSRARERYKTEDVKASPVAAAPAGDSRFGVDEFGFVKSDKGGPIKFGDQKQAAKWILNVGHKTSPDQVFEVANHPKGGFTAQERGRSASDAGFAKMKERTPNLRREEYEGLKRSGLTNEAPAEAAAPEGATARADSTEDLQVQEAPRALGDNTVDPEGSTRTSENDRGRQPESGQPEAGRAPERIDAPVNVKGDEPSRAASSEGVKLYSGLDPDAVSDLLLKPGIRAVKKEIDETVKDFDRVSADLKALAGKADPAKAVRLMGDVARKVWWTNTAAMRALADRYPAVPEIRQLADLIGTDPGRGRVVGQTFERAVQMRAMGMSNRLGNIMDGADATLQKKVADVLAGRVRPLAAAPETKLAGRLRTLLDEQYDYMKDAGLDVGYVKGRYFPRVIDEAKVFGDAATFKTKAADLYRKMGLDAKDAAEAADDWYSRILGVGKGDYAIGLPTSQHTKGRTLPPEADKILADFYFADPAANLTAYFRQTSKAAEFVRSFGKGGEKVDELFNAMLKKGVDPSDITTLRGNFESAAGLLKTSRADKAASALSWVQTAGVLRLLPRAVISSLTEGLAIGIRAHDVGAGFKAMGDSYATLFGWRDHDDMTQAAEYLGIIGDAVNDMVIGSQFGGEVGGQAQAKLLARFFRTTGLHQITEAQRLAAARVGQGMIRTLLQDVTRGNAREASAGRLLRELGMEDADARSVAAWLEKNGGQAPLNELTGTGKEAKLYRTALQRFVDESIQNPTAADRPEWANHPVGRLSYGITSFMFSFTRNVLLRSAKEAGEGVFGKGYTFEDRLRLVAPAVGLAVLAAAQAGVSEARDSVMNPKGKAEQSVAQRAVTDFDRSGLTGNISPFLNIALSARYSRDLTSTLTGPSLTAYLDSFSKMTVGLIPKSIGGPNSPNTNNAEWQASKAAYEAILAPMIAAAGSYAPGGPVLRVGYGAGIMTATSPGAARSFADKVAGERDVAPSAGNGDSSKSTSSYNSEYNPAGKSDSYSGAY